MGSPPARRGFIAWVEHTLDRAAEIPAAGWIDGADGKSCTASATRRLPDNPHDPKQDRYGPWLVPCVAAGPGHRLYFWHGLGGMLGLAAADSDRPQGCNGVQRVQQLRAGRPRAIGLVHWTGYSTHRRLRADRHRGSGLMPPESAGMRADPPVAAPDAASGRTGRLTVGAVIGVAADRHQYGPGCPALFSGFLCRY